MPLQDVGQAVGVAKHTPLSAPPLKTEPASPSGNFKPKQAPLSNPPPHATAAAPAPVAITALLPKAGQNIPQNEVFQVRPVYQTDSFVCSLSEVSEPDCSLCVA